MYSRPTVIFLKRREITRPAHFYFVTSMRSYLLHVSEISRELRFFHARANLGSPYLLLQGRCDAEKKLSSEIEIFPDFFI